MIDGQEANRILASDYEFRQLWRRYNTLGIVRFLVYVVAIVVVISAGINQNAVLLIGSIIASFVVVMIINYNRVLTRGKQQRRALQLGVISEEDLL